MDNAGEVLLPNDGDDDNRPHKSKQYLTEKLDCAEMVIENIRKEALKMAEDLDNVYNSVDAVRNSKLMNYLNDGKLLFRSYRLCVSFGRVAFVF